MDSLIKSWNYFVHVTAQKRMILLRTPQQKYLLENI